MCANVAFDERHKALNAQLNAVVSGELSACELAKQKLSSWMGDQIDKALWEELTKTQFDVREGGFCFVYANWELALKERDYYRSDAQAHYLEALRRQAVCRLDGNDTEAAWYKEFATWFEMKFGCKAATE